MNARFINNQEARFFYERKPDTKTSFYLKKGPIGILPRRISFDKIPLSKIRNKGRAKNQVFKGQIKATFTKKEASKYKACQGHIQSSIWAIPEHPILYGFGDVGVQDPTNEGKTMGTHDLLIILSEDNCKDTFELRIYPGFYPLNMEVAFTYLEKEFRGGLV